MGREEGGEEREKYCIETKGGLSFLIFDLDGRVLDSHKWRTFGNIALHPGTAQCSDAHSSVKQVLAELSVSSISSGEPLRRSFL